MDITILVVGAVLLLFFLLTVFLSKSNIPLQKDYERTAAMLERYRGIELKELRSKIDGIIKGKIDAPADEVRDLVFIMTGKKAKKGEPFYEEDKIRLERLAVIMIKKNREVN